MSIDVIRHVDLAAFELPVVQDLDLAMALMDSIASLFGNKDQPKSQAAKSGPELRRTVRVPQRMRSGQVWHERLISPRAVSIKDMSVGGARVEIMGEPIKATLLADGVRLYFDTEKHEVECKLAWMKGKILGLRFVGRPQPPSRKYK